MKRLRRNYTTREVDMLKSLFPCTSNKELASRFNRTEVSIKSKAQSLGLKKDPDYIKTQQKLSGCRLIKVGVPFTKGHKRNKSYAPGTVRSHIGSRNAEKYKMIKMDNGKWVPLSRHLWEQNYGPLQKNEIITFKDGNSLNCNIENLEKIDLRQNYIRNAASTRLTDGFVAYSMNQKQKDPAFNRVLVQYPKLIEAKRQLIILNRTIHEQNSK